MKYSKLKVLMSLKFQLLTSLMYYFVMVMILIALTPAVKALVEAIERGWSVLRVFEGKWFYLGFMLVTAGTYSWLYFTCASGYIGDILWGRVRELTIVEECQMTRGNAILELRNIVGYELLVRQNHAKPITLQVIEKIEKIPKGDSYKIFYLKRSKVIVGVEVLSGSKSIEKKLKVNKEPLAIRDEGFLFYVMDNHKSRLKIVLMYCVMGIAALIGWLIFTIRDYEYWYRTEMLRCFVSWILLIGLNVAFLFWFLRVDRGGLVEAKRKDVYITEAISTSDLVCSRLLLGLGGRIVGVEVKVRIRDCQEEKFLLYKEASPYWNCLPIMFERMYHSSVLRRFSEGEHNLKAVRFHYLKKSKIIVKMDI